MKNSKFKMCRTETSMEDLDRAKLLPSPAFITNGRVGDNAAHSAVLSRSTATTALWIFLIFTFAFCIASPAQTTNRPAPVALAVMVNTNGVIIQPTNFAAANGLSTNGTAAGLSTNLAPGKIFIGGALSNATAQTVAGDLTLSTNGTATLASAGTAGTYAQVTTDAKGRVTSGTATLPISAGGTGQTTASTGLTALGGASLTANNNFVGSQNFTGGISQIGSAYSSATSMTGMSIYLDDLPAFQTSSRSNNDDQVQIFLGNPWTSLCGTTMALMGTNNKSGSSIYSTNSSSQIIYVEDPVACSFGMVPLQSTPGNLPGEQIMVDNDYIQAICWSSPGGNCSAFVTDPTNGLSGGALLNGGVPYAFNPYLTGWLWGWKFDHNHGNFTIYSNLTIGGTLTSGTGGNVITLADGHLNNGAFSATQSGLVHFDLASPVATNFAAFSHTAFATRVGFDAGANNSGMNFESTPNGGSVPSLIFGTGGSPCFAMTGTNNSWFNQPCTAVGGTELEDGRTWGFSMFDVHGSVGTAINTYTANHTATVQDSTILLNGTTLTNTLPDATFRCAGRIYTVKLIANSTATVNTTSSQKIDGLTSFSLSAQYKWVSVQSDGTQWWVIGNN